MAIYYTGTQVGNQVNFTTGDVTVVANDVKNYIIDQSVSGGQTGLAPSTNAVYVFTTGVSGYFASLNANLTGATGALSNFTGTLGTAAFRDYTTSVTQGGTGLPTSDAVFSFTTGLSGYLYTNAGGLYSISATTPAADVANINLTGQVSGASYNDYVQISGGAGIDITVSSDIISVSHEDTSSVADLVVNASAGSAVNTISFSFDTFGHVTGATGTATAIVRDQIASGVTATAPSEASVYTLSGSLQSQISNVVGLTLQQVTDNGNVTTNGISIGGTLVASGDVTLGSDASDTLTINAGPIVLASATQNSEALVFGANDANRATIYKSDARSLRIDGSLTVTGDLYVSGTTTYLNTQHLNVGDNIITLNADYTGATGIENAGIEVNRGGDPLVALRWNEGTDRWQFTNNGTGYYNIPIDTEFTVYNIEVAAGGANDAEIVLTGSNGDANSITISGNSGILITEIGTGAIVVSHEDTSSASSVTSTNSNGVVIQSFTGLIDTYGHVTGLGLQTTDLDNRYYQTGSVTLDIVTDNGATTDNDIVVGGLAVSGAANAKSDHFVLYNQTTNDTTTELFLQGTSGRIVLASNSAISFRGSITAFDTTNTTAAGWNYECVIANKGGNTSIVGSALVTKLGTDNVGWEVFVDGDNATDSLKLQVKGGSGATINWTASVVSAVVG
jgi:hypothetical protein